MARRDALDVVELSYRLELSDEEWLQELARAFGERLPGTIVPHAYLVSRKEDMRARIDAAFMEGLPGAQTFLQTMADEVDRAVADAFFMVGTDCAFFKQVVGARPEEPQRNVAQGLLAALAEQGGDDILGIRCVDAPSPGVVIGLVTNEPEVSALVEQTFVHLAVHLGAGARLRRILRADTVIEEAEAVFETSGKLAHASGPASDRPARERLQEAVRRIDRARTGSVRKDELAALDLWKALVEGRWSLVDRHDSDGRRYYVAVRNPPVAVRDRALTRMEARVAAAVIAGEPNKVIGYSLGLAESTVSGHLTSALRKLGARSRIELIQIGRALDLDLSGGDEENE